MTTNRAGQWMSREEDMEDFGLLLGKSNARLVPDEDVLVNHFTEMTRAIGVVFFGVEPGEPAMQAFVRGLRRGWGEERRRLHAEPHQASK